MSGNGKNIPESGKKDEEGLLSDVGKYLKPFANPIASGANRAAVLNANEASTPWNTSRIDAAKKEMSPEIKTTIGLVRESLAKVILGIKMAIKMPLKLTNEIVTNVAALPVNIGRWALDILRFPPRILVTATDILAEKTFGNLSKGIANIRSGVHSRLDRIDGLNLNPFKSSGKNGGNNAPKKAPAKAAH
ncbi:MAG: hypothetical protein WC651_00320 [Candidatus Gracilibacteria bacterium]|jgi:hypothetical protein